MLRHGEIHLKGKNKSYFESLLIAAIRRQLKGLPFTLTHKRSRYILSDYPPDAETALIARLKKVFGLHSFSPAYITASTLTAIQEKALEICPASGTFRVKTNRADKRFPINSMELNRYLGEKLLGTHKALKVDLENPDFTVHVDIREDGGSFVYAQTIPGAGGMPIGSAGRGLLLLSGGIDSPVAGYMMAKRGMTVDGLHFHSYPYTGEMAKQKVVKLAAILSGYTGGMQLICLPFAKIQEEIHRYADPSYMITLLRCCMMEAAELVAKRRGASALINGESLGQVASQTIESINVTQAFVKNLPVFRPVIGFDKQEIIEIAHKIGTYQTSILPYEDCCTVFLPDNPVTRPRLENVLNERAKIPGLDALILEAVNNLELLKIV
ncbi:MAG: tRNA 4-thiouridine(8) synthase ThiI [Clostridiales bacterium]|nr:tRNA 4-thiouridine(8) synthase ThiI [Clostridiales bacterium]